MLQKLDNRKGYLIAVVYALFYTMQVLAYEPLVLFKQKGTVQL
jgi:hypothetical protein